MLLLIALLLGQGLPQVPPRMPVDHEPSAFACGFDAALGGADCVFEAPSGPGEARDNSRLAAESGVRACAAAARRDEALRKDCERSVAEASLGPKCAVGSRLADERGLLTSDAAKCVEAVRLVISHTTKAALYLDCCACLGASRCAVPSSQCKHELADLMPGPALQSCMAKSCTEACGFAATPAPPAAETPPAPRATRGNRPDKI